MFDYWSTVYDYTRLFTIIHVDSIIFRLYNYVNLINFLLVTSELKMQKEKVYLISAKVFTYINEILYIAMRTCRRKNPIISKTASSVQKYSPFSDYYSRWVLTYPHKYYTRKHRSAFCVHFILQPKMHPHAPIT